MWIQISRLDAQMAQQMSTTFICNPLQHSGLQVDLDSKCAATTTAAMVMQKFQLQLDEITSGNKFSCPLACLLARRLPARLSLCAIRG